VRPSAGTARIAVQAYLGLGDAAGAAAAQEIVAAATPSAGALGSLALYRYASGDLRRGDAAAEQAVEGVPAAQRAQFRRRLSAVRRTARENGAAITQPGPGNLPGGHGP
jgi:hypothetical protein